MPSRSRADPDSIEAALARSLHHARNALSEALLSASALLDAIAIATAQSRTPTSERSPSGWASLAGSIDELTENLAGKERSRPNWDGPLDRLLDALDNEIARWEMRDQKEAEARTVLRAFLGLREIIGEIQAKSKGASTRSEGSSTRSQEKGEGHSAPSKRRSRVQRV